MKKKLHATIDFYDDLIKAGRFFTPHDIDAMMHCLAIAGITRVDWVVDTLWGALYELPVGEYPNVLHCAVDKAHAHGLQIHAIYKPAERGFEGPRTLYPHTVPMPENVPLLKDLRGIIISLDPFVVKHPELRQRRRPEPPDSGLPVKAVRLIKADSAPTGIKPEHLSLHVSDRNGCLQPYKGAFSFTEHVEWRNVFLGSGMKRIITLRNLDIGAEWSYIFVKCSIKDRRKPDFANTPMEMMELVDAAGNTLAVTPAENKISHEHVSLNFPESVITPYGRDPLVQRFFADPNAVRQACEDFYQYDRSTLVPYRGAPVFLDKRGFAGVYRGKAPTLLGTLSPHSPEVCRHWLSQIQDCLEAGVDGINLRHGGHGCKSHEREAYGFDDPVLQAADGRVDYDVAHRCNGAAYSAFIKEAAATVHARGKQVTIHVNGSFWYRDERTGRTADNDPPIPNQNFEWEDWLRLGFADMVYLKGLSNIAPARRQHVTDTVCRVAEECSIPVVYSGIRLNQPLPDIAATMLEVKHNPRLSGFDLYEAANFAALDQAGNFIAKPEILNLAKDFLK